MRHLALIFCIFPLFSCAGEARVQPGSGGTRIAACPASPNCVSSDATDSSHAIPPLRLAVPAEEAWPAARVAVSALARTQIVSETGNYLHAQCRSAVFGFVDDLELELRPAQGLIAVRSASRIGFSDLGVNRRRVDALKSVLIERGIVR